jgi:hypothetical protein
MDDRRIGGSLQEDRHDGVNLAGSGQPLDEQRVQLGEPRPHRGDVDRVAGAGERRK